jgi:GTPase SAR1 family protein
MALTPEVMAEALARRPIVLIGDVGVGKTSFLKHLMYVSAFEEFQRAAYIYIDLGSQAALDSDLKAFVMSEIEAQLLKRYAVNVYEDSFVKGVYHGELELFRKGIYGSLSNSNPQEYNRKLLEFLEVKIRNKPEHLRHSVQHIVAGRNQQVVLMIDNADQRNLDIQQEAFVIAQNFSQTWTAVVFIAVRPQTFHQSKQAGALSAYPQKIFSISPPRVDLVMEKRLSFALNLSEGRLPVERLHGVRLHLHGLTLFLKTLILSLKTNMELVELLSNITGGNIREAIDLITKFIDSPNVHAEKIISIMEKTGNYLVPVHEFSKSALLGEYSHYHPASSIAMNLFDVRFPDEREHFLVPMVLAYLNYDGAHRNREGFTDTHRVIGEMQNWGFTPQQVEAALRRTTNKRLLETTERVTFDEDITGFIGDMPAAFRITTVGAYHLLRWAPSFAYLDAMVFDTPVFDSNVMGELTRDPGSFDIAERYRKATLFRSYLNAVWHKAGFTAPYFDWMGLLPSGQTSFDSVATAIARHTPRG